MDYIEFEVTSVTEAKRLYAYPFPLVLARQARWTHIMAWPCSSPNAA